MSPDHRPADSFVHLHVASGYSLRYGASSPQALVDRAGELGMAALALTDRDGLYGAVKFVLACRRAGIAPILGVDLATAPTGLVSGLPAWADPSVAVRAAGAGRSPVRGGELVDPYLPRATVLAHGVAAAPRRPEQPVPGGPPCAGWCRPPTWRAGTSAVSAAARSPTSPPSRRTRDRRRRPRATLTVLLGPDSEVGRAVLARRPDLAGAVLRRWKDALPAGALAVEVVCHHGPPGGPLSVDHAGRMLALAREHDVPAVLTNAVRYATPGRRGDGRRARRRAPAGGARRPPRRPRHRPGLPRRRRRRWPGSRPRSRRARAVTTAR